MPRDFPNHEDVLGAAKRWRFRDMRPGETPAEYRNALSAFVRPHDMVESHEIRLGKGWDKWTPVEKFELLRP